MRRVLFPVVLLLLAGCSGPTTDDAMGGMAAAKDAADAVAGDFEYLLYLGTTGTEGPLNWTKYEDAMRAAEAPGTHIAEAFDQDVDNGVEGDGALRSWLTTHFVFDSDRRLLGGLYTQTTPDAVESVYAPFRGPYSGTLALPSLQPDTGMLQLMKSQNPGSGNTTLCGLVSHRDDLHIDSTEAAQIAMGRSIMQAHVEADPAGEFTYNYFPKLDVEPGCPAELTVRSNYWTITHVDLDTYLDGGVPSMAEVVVDASTGAVLDEGVRPLYQPAPTLIEQVIHIVDPLVPGTRPSEGAVPMEVPPGATSLDVSVHRTMAPTYEREGYTRLMAPDGREWGVQPPSGLRQYSVRDPMPGTWTLEYVSYAVPSEHELLVRGVIERV